MATVFKFYDGTNTVDLTGSDIKLDHAYLPQYATPPGDGTIPPDVIETVPVIITPTSADNLAAIIQNAALLRRNAGRYLGDRNNNAPVWWHQKLDGETGERRALVKSIRLALERNPYTAAPPITGSIKGALSVTRHPYWERTADLDFPQAASTSGIVSFLYDHTAAGVGVGAHNLVGDVLARVGWLNIKVTAGELDRLWMGIRPAAKYPGGIATYENIWECEDASGETPVVDADASDGNKVTKTVTDSWAKHLTIGLSDVITGGLPRFDSNFGRNLWLLRYEAAAAETFEIQARFGYSGMTDAEHVRGPIRTVTGEDPTVWNFVDIGSSDVPFTARHLRSYAQEGTWQIQIWMRETSGTGDDCDLDCICPIPVDEGYLILNNCGLAVNQYVRVGAGPQDDMEAIAWDGTSTLAPPIVGPSNFRLPPGDARIVMVHARATSSDKTDTLLVAESDGGAYYERWDGFRGAE